MNRSKLLRFTALFFAFMLCFTLLSRTADQASIAVVSVKKPENMVISHRVTATGKIVQNQELAVTTQPDQRVTSIAVSEGQRVEKGDLLFEIDLDLLEEKILDQKQEMQKQELTLKDARSQKSVSEQQKANEQAQAAESYSLAANRAGVQLSRASEELQRAKKELSEFRKNSKNSGGIDGTVEESLERDCEERAQDYIQAEQELTTLQWQIENDVNAALQKAQNGATLTPNEVVHTQAADSDDIIMDVEDVSGVPGNTSEEPFFDQTYGSSKSNSFFSDPASDSGIQSSGSAGLIDSIEPMQDLNIQSYGSMDQGLDSDIQDFGSADVDIDNGIQSSGSADLGIDSGTQSSGSADVGIDSGIQSSGSADLGIDSGIQSSGSADVGIDSGIQNSGSAGLGLDSSIQSSGSSELGLDSGMQGGNITDPGSDIILQEPEIINLDSDDSTSNLGFDTDLNTDSDGGTNPDANSGSKDDSNSGSGPGSDSPASVTQADLDKIEQSVRDSYSQELKAAREKVETAKADKEKAERALAEYQQERLAASSSQNAQTEQQLIDNVRAAQNNYQDAAIAANEAAVTGGRAVASAGIPNASNSADEMYQISYDQMELQLKKLEALKKEKGKVCAPASGLVTKINITTGEKTTDTTAILMADLSKGYRFTAEITKEQEKYIGTGDLVTLTGNNKKELKEQPVESVAADETNEEMYHITVQVPDDAFEIGMTVNLEFLKKSQNYNTCVPLSALHLDDKNQTYVLVPQEYDSVMGTEIKARKTSVTVLEKNESYAALAEGGISSQAPVIVSSDKTVDEGSRVRISSE